MDLPPCDYRVATPRVGTFFCRHARLHTTHNLVDESLCRHCEWRHQPCVLPRLVPADPLAPPQPAARAAPWEYISTARLIDDTRQLAGRLPSDLSGVAGIPRSGMLPATYLATLLHLPLFELCREHGLRPLGHGLRLANAEQRVGPLLVIDDSVHGGQAMALARNALRRGQSQPACLFAALYPRPEAVGCVDLYARPVAAPHLFEWNLFNCNQTATFACDLDGILCHDWQGDEERGEDYQQFLDHAPPQWLPRRSLIPLMVTARLERHRQATENWLRRHGVRVRELVMGPWTSVAERRAQFDAGQFKGQAYARSACCLFIESDVRQARAIFVATGKPVLCPAAQQVFQ